MQDVGAVGQGKLKTDADFKVSVRLPLAADDARHDVGTGHSADGQVDQIEPVTGASMSTPAFRIQWNQLTPNRPYQSSATS